MSRLIGGLAPFLVLSLVCAPSELPAQERASADSLTRAIVSDALLAGVVRPGGCVAINSIQLEQSSFFRSVTLARGWCVAEHGDTLVVVAAFDDLGTHFVSGSPSGYAFLLRRHSPSIGGRIAEYIHQALVFRGEAYAGSVVVRDAASLPPDVPQRVRRRADAVQRAITLGPGRSRSATIVLHGPAGIQQVEVTLWPDGNITPVSTWLWRRERAGLH
jgi:stage V sporulation protein SpoVS